LGNYIVRSLPPTSPRFEPEALAKLRARREEEARLAFYLAHPNIARIIDGAPAEGPARRQGCSGSATAWACCRRARVAGERDGSAGMSSRSPRQRRCRESSALPCSDSLRSPPVRARGPSLLAVWNPPCLESLAPGLTSNLSWARPGAPQSRAPSGSIHARQPLHACLHSSHHRTRRGRAACAALCPVHWRCPLRLRLLLAQAPVRPPPGTVQAGPPLGSRATA